MRGLHVSGWVLLAIMLGACRGTAVSHPDPAETDPLADARALIEDRSHTRARRRLQQLLRQRPDDAEARYWLAETYYRQDQPAEAVRQYEDLLQRHPAWWPAHHRRWVALLVRDGGAKETRLRIEAEVDALLKDHHEIPGALLAAYHGFYLLRRGERRRQIARSMLQLEWDDEYRAEAAGVLQEELLSTRDPARQRELGERFLQRFNDERGADVVAEIVVAAQGRDLDLTAARSLRERLPANRHLDVALAAALLRVGDASAWTGELLQGSLNAANGERSWYRDQATWERLRAWRRARAELLLAEWQLLRGDQAAAARWARLALPDHPQPWQAYALLARLAEQQGEPERAAVNWRNSLRHGNPAPAAERRLGQLLGADPEALRQRLARDAGVVSFSEISAQVGLGQINAEHVAWGDLDGDGYDDLLLDGKVLANRGGRYFEDVTAGLGIDGEGARGGTWVDVDNDGRLDLFLVYRDTNRLWRNLGGTFRDVTADVFEGGFHGRTVAALWGDLDNDGRLDLYLANYERREFERGLCVPDQLYRNLGGGRLRDVTRGEAAVTDEPYCGRGGVWRDLDGDGWQDIAVANYRLDPNLLWRNRGGSLSEEAGAAGLRGRNVAGAFGHSIGIAAGDVDGDGGDDLYISNLAHPRYLDYSDNSQLAMRVPGDRLRYADRWPSSGIRFEETNADPLLADFDNDGDLDLYVTSIYRGRYSHLYLNDGRGRFRDAGWLSGTRAANGWGAAAADFDRDGDLDILVASRDGVKLFRNGGNQNQWLGVRLQETGCNRFGVGSRVEVQASGRLQRRQLQLSRGTGSQDSLTAHFGLGAAGGPVTVTARNLCGEEFRVRLAAAGRVVTLGPAGGAAVR